MMQDHTPLNWLQDFLHGLAWPAIVVGAYFLGRRQREMEMRLHKAEENIKMIVERHLPAIHNALREIRGLLIGGR